MSGRVTKRVKSFPLKPEHLYKAVEFWIWLYEAADEAVTRWINRPRIGDTRPSTKPAVFQPRQHFNAHGQPKAKLTRAQAEARAAGDDALHAYRCSICQDWHVGHAKRHAA